MQSFTVQQEMQARLDEVDRRRKKQVKRARYEADLAQRRYFHVDPANRLVADSLEADWNNKLRVLHAAQEQSIGRMYCRWAFRLVVGTCISGVSELHAGQRGHTCGDSVATRAEAVMSKIESWL